MFSKSNPGLPEKLDAQPFESPAKKGGQVLDVHSGGGVRMEVDLEAPAETGEIGSGDGCASEVELER
jgi:hypothetical protein